jgi:hypothetical protein
MICDYGNARRSVNDGIVPPCEIYSTYEQSSSTLSYLSVCNKLLTDLDGSERPEPCNWCGRIQVQTCLYIKFTNAQLNAMHGQIQQIRRQIIPEV